MIYLMQAPLHWCWGIDSGSAASRQAKVPSWELQLRPGLSQPVQLQGRQDVTTVPLISRAPTGDNPAHRPLGQPFDQLGRASSLSPLCVPEPHRPNRLNFAGFCVYCLERDCTSPRCEEHHRQADWQICVHCDGTGLDRTRERLCSCHGGLEDMTWSQPTPPPRPSRLNFAGWCLWCGQRWCRASKCVERHARSVWGVCEDCDGLGFDDLAGEPCCCAYGLTETNGTGNLKATG
jgi:hypothetical protein